jgi:membrane fusion protein (multidrug efflux system)
VKLPLPRLPRPFLIAFGVLLLAALGLTLYWRLVLVGVLTTDDARLAGELIDLAPVISGRLAEVRVHEGERVAAGDTLFRLDERDARLRVRQAGEGVRAARADLSSAEARLRRARNGSLPEEIAVAAAEVEKFQAQIRLAEQELERQQRLAQTGSVAGQQIDRLLTGLELDRQSLAEAKARLALLQQGTRPEDLAAAEAALASARARADLAGSAIEQARIAASETAVVAPVAGLIVRRWREPGSNTSSSLPVVTLYDPSTLRLEANIKEKHLALVAPGQRVDIRLDAYPDRVLPGEVVSIVQATQSSFSLIPSEGVAGTFIKVSQRVPVRIRLLTRPAADGDGAEPLLLPGLSAHVRIHVGEQGSGRSGPGGPPR